MSGISSFQKGQADLELAARDLTVLLTPLTSARPALTTLEGVGGALTIPSYYVSVGNFTKSAGVTIGHSPEFNDIDSHGKAGPTRQLASRRVITVGFEAQETKLANLSLYWGTDWLSDRPAVSATGGFAQAIPELPLNMKFRAIILGWDDYNGQDIFVYWIANKVNVSATQDQELVDSNVIRYPYTLNCMSEDATDSPLTVGFCGAGFQALQAANQTGFTGS
jgi:hypothetical protein